MSIVRTKRTDGSFFQADKTYVYDSRLSPIAKYVITYAASRPDDWKFHVKEISQHVSVTRQTVSKGIEQLISYGYANKKYIITNKYKEVDYTFYENPDDNPDFFNTNDIIDDF